MKSKTSIIVGPVLALAITATEPVRAMGHTDSCHCTWEDPVHPPPQTTIASKTNVLIETGLLFGLGLIPFAWIWGRRVGGPSRAHFS
jgi:hypothetical protein